MELGECIFLAKGDLDSLSPSAPELELQAKGQGKRTTLQLVTSQLVTDDGSPYVLATVDRALTNRDAQLPQNRRGVSNPAGQLLSVLAAGLADAQVLSASPYGAGVVAVRATVRLLPAAFDVVVPEQTSRAAAYLGDGAAAAAAAASVAGALLDVVRMFQERREPTAEAGDDAVLCDPGPSTSAGSEPRDAQQQGEAHPAGDDEERHHYSDVRDEIFDIVAPRDWHTTHPNPPGLKCKLFPYQQRALSWMVWRETQPELGRGLGREPQQGWSGSAEAAAEAEDVVTAATAAATAHLGDFASQDLFWRRVEVRGGQELWVNPFPGGGLRREPPPPPRRQRVGILADEMGLGKTVEVIALMLARPPQQQQRGGAAGVGSYCAADGGGGGRFLGPNLIVTPPSILQQWAYEIANHSNLKVCVYDGLRWHRQQSEEKEKERIKEVKREARLAVQREKEAKRQERAWLQAERAAARAAKQKTRQDRKRARSASAARGSSRGRTKRRGNDTEEEEEEDGHDEDEEDAEAGAAAGAGGQTKEAGPSIARQTPFGGAPSAVGTVDAGPAANGDGAGSAAHPLRKLRVRFAAGSHSLGSGAGTGAEPNTSVSSQRGPGGPQVAANGAAAGRDGSEAGGLTVAARVAMPSRMQLYQRELMAALYAGTPLCPASCDPQAEARAAVQELLDADVVLTTYSVLKEEVHYSPSNRVLSGLRHEKKYSVPESPLLQIRWQRLVMDEAQLVGGSYSHVVQMAARIEASHRWCVTGTPIGAGGLDDILGLLCVLKYGPYDDAGVFKHLISEPYRSGSAEGHSRLAALIKPIMWRNSKAVAAQDHPLPRRVLQEAHLRFSAAEETFYDVILGETRKAYNEMTSHQEQQTLQRAHQQQEQEQQAQQQDGRQGEQRQPQEGQQRLQNGNRRRSVVVDLTGDGEGQAAGGSGSGAGPSSQQGSQAVVKHQGPGTSSKHHLHTKRRRGQDRGETLAQVAGAELHQLRLACVHIKLTSYWQKLGQELALHGQHHGAVGGAAALPAIDDVMARLRDQAQLHLQNAERDLCVVLNALAARLEATARKVRAMGARRMLQEATSPGGSAGAAARQGGAAAAAAGAIADETADEEGVRSVEKKAKRRKEAAGGSEGAAAAVTAVDADATADGEAQGGEGGAAAAGGGAEAENAVHPFRYNASGKTAAALSADAERMLRECNELLETSWNVGENGIEAAAAAEGAAVAAAAAAGEELEKDIKAASASIRSWRFVQAHTSQLLADLLTTHPQVCAPAAVDGSGADPSCAAAGAASALSAPANAADAAAAAASAATAASLRAAELRAYVNSRATDVRATADRELQRARERLDRINATIARLRQQIVEEYDTAVAHGLPDGVVPEPRAWLEDVQARLDAARQVEAAHRAEKQAAAAAGATVALMGKEVGALLSSEEAAVTRQRVGLEAVAGSLLVATALDRLRAADRGLRAGHGHGHGHGQQLEPGPEWRSVLVGGVTMLLPPEGATSLASDPRLAARADWCLAYPPAVGLLRYAVSAATQVEPAEMAARGIAHGFDQMTVLLCERHLRHPIRMLESRLQDQRKTADHQGTAKLRGHGLVMLLPALEAVRLCIELLRTWKEHHMAELQVEVAENQCEVVTGEVMAAAQGHLPGMTPLLKLSEEELRHQVSQLKARCEELRHKKSFFHNQYLEATSLRHGGPAPAAATGPAAGGAGRHPPAAHAEGKRTQPTMGHVSSSGASTPPPAAAAAVGNAAAAERVAREQDSAAGEHGSSSGLAGAGGSGRPAPAAHAPSAPAGALSPDTSRVAHVGVACRTGILACLHPWEQWRPGYGHSNPIGQADGTRRVATSDVYDLTGADDMDVDGMAADPRVGGGSASSTGVDGASAASTAPSAAARTEAEEAAAPPAVPQTEVTLERTATPDATHGAPGSSPPAVGVAAAIEAAAAVRVAAADGPAAAAPAGQAAENTPTDRAAAAAAAARARMAAEMAAAKARLGLGLGAVDGGIGGDGDGEKEEGGLTCAVCADTLTTDIRLFPCGHYYCASCSDLILGPTGNRRCPTCRFYVREKDSVVKVGGVSAPAAGGGAGAGGAGSRVRPRAGSCMDGSGEVDPPEGQHILTVKIEGGSELMCKIGALMRRLVWLRDHRPAEKSLVFSQWSDALQIVERGLRTNNIGYVSLETGRRMRAAMSAFLNDDSCRVFLLSLRQGAAGLTLVRANHVFLLEPSLDPAIEQQAVARVHRIGQTRDVTVTRLLVDGTVEEAVMRMLKEKQQLFMEGIVSSAAGSRGAAASRPHTGAGPSTSGAPRAGAGSGAAGLVPSAVPLLEGGEGEEASLPTAAPRQEVLAGADMSYLLNAVLL
ncbi:hypothetical protein PLESTB_000145900 [Pleodorina starrii]|uniref:Uncharacterized protein n=1 Tax=Pleodorina starrii TaxID=330485 RepID=A0A9W6BB00_9CHLO|nr:hypothetical protein PLESTB_000145900 [Pleodorina starrii]GLC72507.1 hypothetical protein PLESTF_001258500 [Pleodorina starrii]